MIHFSTTIHSSRPMLGGYYFISVQPVSTSDPTYRFIALAEMSLQLRNNTLYNITVVSCFDTEQYSSFLVGMCTIMTTRYCNTILSKLIASNAHAFCLQLPTWYYEAMFPHEHIYRYEFLMYNLISAVLLLTLFVLYL